MDSPLLQRALAAYRGGDLDEAARLLEVCLADGEDADPLYLRGLVELERGAPGAALTWLDRATAADGEHPVVWWHRARVNVALGRRREAVTDLRRALALRPAFVQARAALGDLLLELGEPAAAAEVLAGDGALRARLGDARAALGDLAGAEAAWREALAADPSHAGAAHALAGLLEARGDPEGLAWRRRAVRAAPEVHALWVALVDALSRADDVPDDLEPDLLAALSRDGLDHQRLARAGRTVLARKPVFSEAFEGEADVRLLDDPLFRALLVRTLFAQPEWEDLLVRLRSAGPTDPGAVAALATQAFHVEYVWPGEGEGVLYRPLRPGEPGPEALVDLQVRIPAREAEVVDAIGVLALTDDATSAAVRTQYEEAPYPRLVSWHRKAPRPFPEVVRPWAEVEDPGEVKILVAGCGTGRQALIAATRYARARVLAVDLSRRSLAAAFVLAERHGIDNVDFQQADLLALDVLQERFHLVEAGGVLHHLADPLEGWRVLVDRLAPGGLMKIGLYSKHGRRDVDAALALRDARGWTADDVRRVRAEILALPRDHPARRLAASPDFYSRSGVRDLLFHPCEHRFDLPGLAAALDSLGLELLGFQHPHPEPDRRYDARFPGDPLRRDLARWAAIEEDHPHLFAGMYQFWCHRR